jgi:hypothetical protein
VVRDLAHVTSHCYTRKSFHCVFLTIPVFTATGERSIIQRAEAVVDPGFFNREGRRNLTTFYRHLRGTVKTTARAQCFRSTVKPTVCHQYIVCRYRTAHRSGNEVTDVQKTNINRFINATLRKHVINRTLSSFTRLHAIIFIR